MSGMASELAQWLLVLAKQVEAGAHSTLDADDYTCIRAAAAELSRSVEVERALILMATRVAEWVDPAHYGNEIRRAHVERLVSDARAAIGRKD